MIRSAVLLGAVCCCTFCCTFDDEAYDERELFRKRFQDYLHAEGHEKTAALEALRRLRPRTQPVRDVRAACLGSAEGVARAEVEAARAERLLGDLEDRVRALPAAERARELANGEPPIRKSIQASNDAAAGARPLTDRCFRLVDALRQAE